MSLPLGSGRGGSNGIKRGGWATSGRTGQGIIAVRRRRPAANTGTFQSGKLRFEL